MWNISPKFHVISIFFSTVLFLLVLSCKQAQKVADLIVQPTPRQLYARQFKNDSLQLSQWENAFQESFSDSLYIELPYAESATYFKGNSVVHSYILGLHKGEILHVELQADSLAPPIFIDLFEKKSDTLETYNFLARNENNQKGFEKAIERTGRYRLTVQPGFDSNGRFRLGMYTTPQFAFPVMGKDNQAIQSFWGADRDGGQRSHKGVDIFADRGTPVVAVTKGIVSSTGERGLGGKQVWLRSGILGNSLYYAHLDSVLVKTGKRVQIGDTLGLVGNTGNARTTAPHLHFGIYEGYRGAVDPLPFIRINDKPPVYEDTVFLVSPDITVSATKANLRNSPSTQASKIGEAMKSDTLSILGISGKWMHIKTGKGNKAYVHRSLIDLAAKK